MLNKQNRLCSPRFVGTINVVLQSDYKNLLIFVWSRTFCFLYKIAGIWSAFWISEEKAFGRLFERILVFLTLSNIATYSSEPKNSMQNKLHIRSHMNSACFAEIFSRDANLCAFSKCTWVQILEPANKTQGTSGCFWDSLSFRMAFFRHETLPSLCLTRSFVYSLECVRETWTKWCLYLHPYLQSTLPRQERFLLLYEWFDLPASPPNAKEKLWRPMATVGFPTTASQLALISWLLEPSKIPSGRATQREGQT